MLDGLFRLLEHEQCSCQVGVDMHTFLKIVKRFKLTHIFCLTYSSSVGK